MHWQKCLKPLPLQIAHSNLEAVGLKLDDVPLGCVGGRHAISCAFDIRIGYFILSQVGNHEASQ